MFAFCHVVFLLMVIGWSRWKILQNDQTMLLVVVVLKLLKIPYELWLKNSLREYWLMTSFLITWSIMEFLVMLGSPTLMLFLIAFTGSILFDCLKRMFLNPCLLRRAQISMTGRRKKVHGREAYDHLLSSARTYNPLLVLVLLLLVSVKVHLNVLLDPFDPFDPFFLDPSWPFGTGTSSLKELCCGFRFTKNELNTNVVKKFQHVMAKEGVSDGTC